MSWIDPYQYYERPPRCCDDERELMEERAYRHLAEERRHRARRQRRAVRELVRAWAASVSAIARTLIDGRRAGTGQPPERRAGETR